VERSSGVKVRVVGYLLMPHHDIERVSLQLSTRPARAGLPSFDLIEIPRQHEKRACNRSSQTRLPLSEREAHAAASCLDARVRTARRSDKG